MAELSDPKIGTVLEGRYRLDEKLGSGGMGVVYKAERVGIGKVVAIKFLHDSLAAIPDLVKRFTREAQAMSRLSHPNIISVIDHGLQGGVPFLVMDFHLGQSLGDVLVDGALEPERAVGIARQILAGMQHAHSSGVVHRDLKPDNIMLLSGVDGDFVKILDFGLAKIVGGDGEDSSNLTDTGIALGTPGYISPEQAKGVKSDLRSDIYSVGVILYQMVVGKKPFVAESPLGVLRMHMEDAPTPPRKAAPKSGCSVQLEAAILKALEKLPANRYQSAAKFAQALEATPEGQVALPFAEMSMHEVGKSDVETKAAKAAKDKFRTAKVKKARARVAAADRSAIRRVGSWVQSAVLLSLVALGGFIIVWVLYHPKSSQKIRKSIEATGREVAEEAWRSSRPRTGEAPPIKTSPPTSAPPIVPPATAPAAGAPLHPASPVVPTTDGKPGESETKVGEAKPAEGKPLAPPIKDETKDQTKPTDQTEGKLTEEGEDAVSDEEPRPPEDTPGAKLERAVRESGPRPGEKARAPAAKKPQHTMQEAWRLYGAGRYEQAIKALYVVRERAPKDGDVALLLGHSYFKLLWRTDGLREYNNALAQKPSLRHDKTMQRNVVGALDDPTYRIARWILATRIGPSALAELRQAVRSSKSAKVKRRANQLGVEIAARARR